MEVIKIVYLLDIKMFTRFHSSKEILRGFKLEKYLNSTEFLLPLSNNKSRSQI